MKVYGNLMNRIMESAKPAHPEVGMGATITMYSDRYPATIVGVELFKSGPNKGTASVIRVQEDDAVRTDKNGMSEDQDYDYTPNTNNPIITFTRRKNGSFTEKGRTSGLIVGRRDKYYDFSF
jgi:hypothetical protein